MPSSLLLNQFINSLPGKPRHVVNTVTKTRAAKRVQVNSLNPPPPHPHPPATHTALLMLMAEVVAVTVPRQGRTRPRQLQDNTSAPSHGKCLQCWLPKAQGISIWFIWMSPTRGRCLRCFAMCLGRDQWNVYWRPRAKSECDLMFRANECHHVAWLKKFYRSCTGVGSEKIIKSMLFNHVIHNTYI